MTTPRKEKKREARREEKAAALDKVIHEPHATYAHECIDSMLFLQLSLGLNKYNKVLDIEEGQAASEDEDEMDSEIEYVEAYEELGTKDDKEDFGGLEIARSQMDNDNGNANSQMCFLNGIRKNEFHVAVGMDSDDEKVEPIVGKRVRKETASAMRKLEKDGHDGKSKKRARVLVEEMIDDIF
ncbi:hypothetical protein CFP56_019516, partial [Quercus suber]